MENDLSEYLKIALVILHNSFLLFAFRFLLTIQDTGQTVS